MDGDTEELYEQAPCGFLSTAFDGTVLRVNDTLLAWLGTTREALVGQRRFQDLLAPGPRVLWQTHHLRQLTQLGSTSGVSLDLTADTGAVPVLLSAVLVDRPGRAPLLRFTLFDASERRAYEERLLAARATAERAELRLGVLQRVAEVCAQAGPDEASLLRTVVDAVGEAVVARAAAAWTTGRTGLQPVPGGGHDAPAPPEDQAAPLARTCAAAAVVVRAAAPSTGATRTSCVAVPVLDRDRVLAVVVLQLGDEALEVDDDLLLAVGAQTGQALVRVRADAEVRRLALHDGLTGLANRVLLADRLELALQRTRRAAAPLALLLLDLDGFKAVNDMLGHQAGDLVLQEVSRRLSAVTRDGDTVARLGGDEFAVLCEVADGSDAERQAERLRRAAAEPVRVEGLPVALSASIGIALQLPGASPVSAEELLAKADAAMYQVKRTGKDNWSSTTVASVVRRRVEHELQRGLDGESLELHYQPVFDLRAGGLVGLEVLCRLRAEDGVLIGPNEFLPVAEALGLLPELGARVLRLACEQGEAWRRRGLDPRSLAVNVAAAQVARPDFADVVLQVVAGAGWPTADLVLEITESALLDVSAPALRAMRRLRAAGVGLALDDFGTRSASLQHVQRFPFSELKIDRSFVRGLPSRADTAIVRSVAQLAADMGWTCVAEGIETQQHLEVLSRLDVRGQGHLLGRPVAAADVEGALPPAGVGDQAPRGAERGGAAPSR